MALSVEAAALALAITWTAWSLLHAGAYERTPLKQQAGLHALLGALGLLFIASFVVALMAPHRLPAELQHAFR